MTPWTTDRQAHVLRLYDCGLTIAAIAREVGMSRSAVSCRLSRMHVLGAHRANQFARSPWTRERHAELCALFDEGLSYRRIAAVLGMTKGQIVGRLYRTGMTFRCRYAARGYDGPSTLERLQQMHDAMDALLAECSALHRSGRMTYRLGGLR